MCWGLCLSRTLWVGPSLVASAQCPCAGVPAASAGTSVWWLEARGAGGGCGTPLHKAERRVLPGLRCAHGALSLFQSDGGGAFKGFKGLVVPSGGAFSAFGTNVKPLEGLANGNSAAGPPPLSSTPKAAIGKRREDSPAPAPRQKGVVVGSAPRGHRHRHFCSVGAPGGTQGYSRFCLEVTCARDSGQDRAVAGGPKWALRASCAEAK